MRAFLMPVRRAVLCLDIAPYTFVVDQSVANTAAADQLLVL